MNLSIEVRKVRVYQASDGSQVLVEEWPDGTVDVSLRPDGGSIWGPPLDLIREVRE